MPGNLKHEASRLQSKGFLIYLVLLSRDFLFVFGLPPSKSKSRIRCAVYCAKGFKFRKIWKISAENTHARPRGISAHTRSGTPRSGDSDKSGHECGRIDYRFTGISKLTGESGQIQTSAQEFRVAGKHDKIPQKILIGH